MSFLDEWILFNVIIQLRTVKLPAIYPVLRRLKSTEELKKTHLDRNMYSYTIKAPFENLNKYSIIHSA